MNYSAKDKSITSDELAKALKNLNKEININQIDPLYLIFLNECGSICCESFSTVGNIYSEDTEVNTVTYMVGKQQAFKRYFYEILDPSDLKKIWVIAEIDQSDIFYMDFSKEKEYKICFIDISGGIESCAKNFSGFLNYFVDKLKEELKLDE